jgi:alkylation response protein AidB-like acyl-CoA dehydrogenase
MDLLLSEEQTMLRESAVTFAQRQNGAERLREIRESNTKIDRGLWQEMANAGWLAIAVSEDAGGLGLGSTEICLVAEELGRGLIPEPVPAAAAVAAAIGNDPAVGEIVGGSTIIMPALAEGKRAIGDEKPSVKASGSNDDVRLAGAKSGIPNAADCNGFVVSASSPDGPVLAYVAAADALFSAADTIDGGTIDVLQFDDTSARIVCGPNEAPPAITRLLDMLHLATAAELLGVMHQAHEITVEYLKTREQFDRPIGSFQALQHQAVDNLVATEMSKSLIYQAAQAIDACGSAPGLASAALSRTATSALDVCKSTIQLHGGIGFTDEHDIGLYLKRAMTLSVRYGNAGLHRKRYAAAAEAYA